MAADELEFEPHTHVYRWRGERLPSVTTILRAAAISPDYGRVRSEVLARAAARGTAAHAACASLDLAEDPDLSVINVDYAAAYGQWCALTGYTPIATEVRVVHPLYRYAGTADMVGWLGSERVLADRKTEGAFNASAWLQVEAYRHAWDVAHPRERIDRTGVVVLRAGKPAVWMTTPHADTAWLEFMAALDVYRRAGDDAHE